MLISLQIIVHVTFVGVAQGSAKKKKKRAAWCSVSVRQHLFRICVSRPYLHSCSRTTVTCFSSDTLPWSEEVGMGSNLSAFLALVINLSTQAFCYMFIRRAIIHTKFNSGWPQHWEGGINVKDYLWHSQQLIKPPLWSETAYKVQKEMNSTMCPFAVFQISECNLKWTSSHSECLPLICIMRLRTPWATSPNYLLHTKERVPFMPIVHTHHLQIVWMG